MAIQGIGTRTYDHDGVSFTSRFEVFTDDNGRRVREYPVTWPTPPEHTPIYVDGDWREGDPWDDGAICAAASTRKGDIEMALADMKTLPDGSIEERIEIRLDARVLGIVVFVEPAPPTF